jgi:hypothetical protein
LGGYWTGRNFHGMQDVYGYRLLAFPIPLLYRPMH